MHIKSGNCNVRKMALRLFGWYGDNVEKQRKPLNTLEKRYQGRLPFAIVHSSFFVIFHLRFSTFCVENTVVFHIFDVLCGILHGKSIICDFFYFLHRPWLFVASLRSDMPAEAFCFPPQKKAESSRLTLETKELCSFGRKSHPSTMVIHIFAKQNVCINSDWSSILPLLQMQKAIQTTAACSRSNHNDLKKCGYDFLNDPAMRRI